MNIPFSRYWDLLAEHVRSQRGRFALLTVLLLSSIGLQILNPQVTRYFIDATQAGDATRSLLYAALAFMGIALVQQVTSVSATYVGENVAWTATNALRAELAAHCLRLDMSFHNSVSPGELIERIDGDVMELSNFFSQLVIRVMGNLILLFGIVVALLTVDMRLGLLFFIFAAVTLLALNTVRGVAIPYQKALRQATADLMGYLEERLAGTEDIRSSGAVDFVVVGMYKLMYQILVHWRQASWRMLIVYSVAGILLAVGTTIAFLSGYSLFGSGVISIGTAYLIVHYTSLLRRPIREITQQLENLQNIGAATERLTELRAVESKIQDGSGVEIASGPLAVDFDSVSFGYHDEVRVVNEISFHLEPGRVLGLLGRTGSGKTTLARLVFRLYDLSAGRILLGGTDIRDASLDQLRRQVALVTQDVQLFQASVRDNLTFFDPAFSDENILDVIGELGLGGWLDTLPDGLDTRLAAGGRSLSAGEAQLLALARVFLRDPGLVILDEASSRLDPATEQLIERAVDRLLENRTAIVIAHRLGTVRRADEILILEKGSALEHGPRRQLAADSSSQFYHLLQTGLEEVLA
jgi:ABC-type multidrug transport system fused ATPase/permease subunit